MKPGDKEVERPPLLAWCDAKDQIDLILYFFLVLGGRDSWSQDTGLKPEKRRVKGRPFSPSFLCPLCAI